LFSDEHCFITAKVLHRREYPNVRHPGLTPAVLHYVYMVNADWRVFIIPTKSGAGPIVSIDADRVRPRTIWNSAPKMYGRNGPARPCRFSSRRPSGRTGEARNPPRRQLHGCVIYYIPVMMAGSQSDPAHRGWAASRATYA
jgi:hypothetical protein